MISIHDLRDKHTGRPAAVLGGGPSLPADLERVPAGSVLIGVNQHALRLVKTDYLVFLDDPMRFPILRTAVESFDGIRVTRRKGWGDVDLQGEFRIWMGQLSGHLGAWFAYWLGCAPILLCGMDCYQGEQKYFYGDQRSGTGFHAQLLTNLNGWREVQRMCPHSERFRAVSGPLVEIFGVY